MIKNKRGISYLEIVISIAIIAYIAMAFTRFFLQTAINVQQTKFHTLAYNWASDGMEFIKSQSFSFITQNNLNTYVNDSKELIPGKVFTRQATVTDEAGDLKKIDIIVTWTGRDKTRTVSISTYICDII